MKAVYCTKYGPADVLEVREVLTPTIKKDEILIKNNASSITTADTFLRKGTPVLGRLFLGLFKPKNPLVGTGFSGVVVKVGEHRIDFKVGDRVYGETTLNFGANAEYVCVGSQSIIQHIPNTVSFEEAAPICDGVLTSYNFLVDIGKLKSNQHILINGASGALGVAAIQIAKNIGAKVTTVCSANNIELVKSLGADYCIDYTKQDFTKQQITYDIIYDSIGESSFSKSKKVLKNTGVYLSPVLSFSLLLMMLKTAVIGSKKAKFQATGLRKVEDLNHFLAQIHILFNKGQLKTVIDRTYTINQIVAAHKYVDSRRKKGNIILVF